MNKIIFLLVFIAPQICYAGRGGYTLGKSSFGDFFGIVLYSIGLVYFYYQFFAHFSEIKREGLRSNLTFLVALMFYSVPLLIPFLNTADKKYSSTPRSYQTYVREDFNHPTRTYSPPKSDYRPIDQPKQYTPIEVNTVSNSGLRQDIQIDSEAMRKYFDEREQARITREKFLKELMADMEAQRLERELANKQRQAEIEAERREQEAARKRLQAEYEANRGITEALMNSNRYLDEPIPYPSNEPVPYYPSEPEPYSPIVQSYKVDGKSLEERLKDIEQEQHRREQIFGKRDSFPNKLFGSHSYSPTLP